MKVLLDIPDKKSDFVLKLLRDYRFVKAEPISAKKAQFLKEFKESIDEVNLAHQGKIKLKSADELIAEF